MARLFVEAATEIAILTVAFLFPFCIPNLENCYYTYGHRQFLDCYETRQYNPRDLELLFDIFTHERFIDILGCRLRISTLFQPGFLGV